MLTKLNQIKKVTRRLARDFARDTGGAIALMLGLAVVPMILASGLAIDFYRVGSAKAQIQASLDASVLAGAAANPGATEAERRKVAIDSFNANLHGGIAGGLKGEPLVTFDNSRITISYNGDLPTTLLAVGGFNKMSIGASSSATMKKPGRAEIAMVLDYSGSMDKLSAGQKKYVTMREAAIKMVNGLTDNGTNTEVEFGLVPFSHNVFVTLPGNFVVGAAGGSWTGCTYDRQYPYNTTSAAPGSSNNSKWGQPAPTFVPKDDQGQYFCDGKNHDGKGYLANKLQVRELTSSHSATISQLKAMRPYGYTNISLGTAFGWHLLDSGAPFSARSDSDKENKKFLVVLTDGEQTTPAFGPGGSRDRFAGEGNLTTLCSNIKSDNKITIITIAFALDDSATENRLRNCSTDPDKHFFKAEDGNDLTRAFEEIQSQIATAIYLAN